MPSPRGGPKSSSGRAKPRFELGSFTALPLDPESMDAVVCIDAFMFAPDKAAAAAEIARVMKPGARFAMTVFGWRIDPPSESGTLRDYRPVMEDAGLRILRHEEPPRWQEHQTALYENWIANEAALVSELGQEVADGLLLEARTLGPELDDRQQVLLIAERP